jgi:hypothetical protein
MCFLLEHLQLLFLVARAGDSHGMCACFDRVLCPVHHIVATLHVYPLSATMSSGIALQRNNECVQRMTNSAPANEQQLAAVLRNHRTTKTSLPSDFLQLQSLRSSALAHKSW